MESPFTSLPRELVTEILGRVAASSSIDLHSSKLCCKEFFEVAEEQHIHKQISLEKIPIVHQWQKNHRISKFLDKCARSRNPEALFRKGVVDYFRGKDLKNAFECLEDASKSGHLEASYAMAIILLFGGGESKEKGITLLSKMKKSRMHKRMVENCQKRLRSILRRIWVINASFLRQRPICCTIHRERRRRRRRRRRRGWLNEEIRDEKDDNIFCDGCICDEEIGLICDALPQLT